MISTEDFAQHDQCQRLHSYTSRYEPLRVSLNSALNESLYSAFSNNNPAFASDKFMALASSPGIDMEATSLYPSVIHHSRLSELIATYVLAVAKVSVPDPVKDFQPKSFLMEDGRLRRVVLVDRWSKDRESLERFSWRTVADTSLANLPMVITAIVIGGSRAGFRPTPWTQGFLHPQNGGVRVLKRDGESFGENWKSVYRENTDIKPLEWLRIMQQDGAFEGRVFSFTEDVPKNREEILEQMAVMASEMGSLRPTRSACYRFRPCAFLPACLTNQSPMQMGWVEKDSLLNHGGAKLTLTI